MAFGDAISQIYGGTYDPSQDEPDYNGYGSDWWYGGDGGTTSADTSGMDANSIFGSPQVPDAYAQYSPPGGGLPQTPGKQGYTNSDMIQAMIKQLGPQNAMSAIGKTAGAVGSQMGKDRIIKGDFTQSADEQMMKFNPMKQLAHDNYVLQGGSGFNSAAAHLPYSYGLAPKAPSDAMKQYAAKQQGDITKRGWTQPTDVKDYASPSMMEKLLGYGGAAASGIGAIQQARDQNNQGGIPWGKIGNTAGSIFGKIGSWFGGGGGDDGGE